MDYLNKLRSIAEMNYLNRILSFNFRALKKSSVFILIGLFVVLVVTVSFGKPSRQIVDTKKPFAPSGFSVEQSEDGLLASWHPSAGAKSYTLFWGTDQGEYRKMFTTGETAVLLKGFESGQIYNFAVTASNDSYESDFSNEFFFVYDDAPRNSMDHVAKAKDLMDDRRHTEALAFLNTAIRLDPENPESYRTRAMLLESLGKKDEARNDFKKSETLFGNKQMTSTK